MQEGIKVIKLSSGDTVVADLTFLQNEGPFVRLDNPVQFTMMYGGRSDGTLVAQQWLETEETSFKIPRHHLVAVAEPNEMLKDYYYSSLEEITAESEEDILSALINFDGTTYH